MKTILTLDKANKPYGFLQLNGNGNFDNIIVESGLTANTISAATISADNISAVTISASTYYGVTNPTSGYLPYNNGGLFADSVIYYNGGNVGISTATLTGKLNIEQNNTNYTNTNGAGSHIVFTNPNPNGQNVLSSFINGNLVAKWRTDYVGNISWVAGATGEHDFFTQGDYAVGSIKMRIFNNGNVQIAKSPVGGAIADSGYKLDVIGTGKFSATTDPLKLEGLQSATDSNVLTVDGSGVVHTYAISSLTGGSSSGAYLPLSGGTVTGATNFTNGLTVNTISATTYYNVNAVTGGTYSNGTITLSGTGSVNGNTITGFPTSLTGAYLPLSGGTMTGGIVANSGVTANTISQTQYIDFTTGSTNPSSVAGRVFFDTTSKALSYFDISNNQVPIAMGQQLYTRVWNATGAQIDKGKVIAITGTTNGLPSAILARNNHSITSARPIGLAAENIPNGSEGLVITNGILSGITLNTFANSDTLYLSDTTPGGYISNTAQLAFTARTNEIGYVLQTGTTTGKIYVTINNEDSNLSLTDIERNILEGNVISSGVYQYTGMTQGTGQTINVAMARGWVVRNTYEYATLPDVTNIYYTGGTNIPLTYLNSADATYILINSASTLYQQTTFPTPQQRRENLLLGKVVHPNRSTITSLNQTVDFDVSPMAAIRDLWTPIKLINQGVIASYNGANLSINTSAGLLWGNGIGWTTNQLNPDSVSISGTSPTTFQYRTQLGPITGGTAPYTGNTTFVDPNNYDVNGVVTAVGGGSNSSTNQRIFLFPTGLVRIQYGQKVYTNLAEAIAGVQTEQFVEYSNNRDNGILIGILSVTKGVTVLNNTSTAIFNYVSKFGEVLGGTGGISTTTLQQAYNNSVQPEITINSTLDGLSIKNGTGNADNVTNLLEGIPSATAGATSFIRADGLISGSSVSAPTISGTTFFGLPLSITSTTQSSNLLTLTNNTGGTTTYTPNAATGGTYSNGVITLAGSGTLSTITGLGGSGGGGQVYYLNLSVNQTPYKEFSPIPTTAVQQSTGTSISSGVTSTLASFLSPSGYPGTNLLPAGIWSFYLHSYKTNIGDSFTTYAQVYKRTTGGTETLLFSTDPAFVDGYSPTPRMGLSDVYYSGITLNLTDRILVVIKGTNNGTSTSTLTLVTEGSLYYSYCTTTFGGGTPNYTTGGTYSNSTGILTFTRTDGNTYTAGTFSYLTAATLSAANVLSVASNGGSPTTTTVNAVTGGTYSSGTITLSGTGSVNGTQITGFSTSTATAFTGGTVSGATNFTGGVTANTLTVSAATDPVKFVGLQSTTTDTSLLSVDNTGVVHTVPLFTWNNATTAQTASVSNGYVGTASTLTTITLPTGATFGSVIEVVGTGTGLWRISQNANQFIKFGITGTTTGTGGYLSATSQYDCVKLLCTSANTAFVVTSAIGNIFYN